MKEIIFFLTYLGRSKDVFALQAQLLLEHLKRGDKVTIVVDLDGSIFSNQVRYTMIAARRYEAKILFEKLLRVIRSFKAQYKVVGYEKSDVNLESVPAFKNVEELKKYTFRSYKIGLSVASYIMDETRDHLFSTIRNRKKIEHQILVASSVLNTIEFYSNITKPDLVYVHNGRLSHYAPVVIYCEVKVINFLVFEFPFLPNKFELVPNTIPHNIKYVHKRIVDCWRKSNLSEEEKEKIAHEFFNSNQRGKPIVGINFTDRQKIQDKIELPTGKEIITFFNSSIDEFASVPHWEEYIFVFEDEVEAIREICKYFEEDNSKHFVLRIHPNLMYLNNTQVKKLKQLKPIRNLTIFSPESSVYSYQLLMESSKIITFGSTVGIEATFFEKPSVLLGLSFYKYLDVCYIPNTKNELYNIINDENLPPKPKKNTYPYGFWALKFGEDYNFSKDTFDENYFTLSNSQKKIFFLKKIFSKSFFKYLLNNRNLKRLVNKNQRERLFKLLYKN